MAGAGAETALLGRQAEARENIEDGTAGHPTTARYRRDGGDPLGPAQGRAQHPWLARLLERKPPMVAAFALANKMARGIWAMLTRKEDYRDPVSVGT